MEESLNILNFWSSTVIDLIFQHLSGKEVLIATTVHSSWNEFLSEHSLTAWKDILISPQLGEDLIYLVNSKRRFQQLEAKRSMSIMKSLKDIIEKPERKWKSISIIKSIFENEHQVFKMMQAIAKTIEILRMNSIATYLREPKKSENNFQLDFPALKTLHISYYNNEDGLPWLNQFFNSTPQLESLETSNGCDSNITNIIVRSLKLKKFSTYGQFYDVNFFKTLSNCSTLRLEELEINGVVSNSAEDENLSHFNNFFKSQSKTLKVFNTDTLLWLDEFETAFAMKKLESLSILGFYYNRDLINEYLEDLRSREIEIPAASLKHFRAETVDQKLLELLAINARNLEVIEVFKLDVIDASNPAWFPKLKTLKLEFYNNQIFDKIRAKTVIERNRTEKLIYECIQNQ